jgi:Tol biopolymer transport system component
MVGSLDGGPPVTLFKTVSLVQFVEPGYLLYVRDQMLVAHRFDVKTLTLQGEAVPIGQGLGVDTVGLASFSASRTGVLAFRGGELRGQRLAWLDRTGKETPLIDTSGDYRDTSISPDGNRVAYDSISGGKGNIWVRDVARGVTSRFTFSDGLDQVPNWSADGRQMIYSSRGKTALDLYVKDTSGTRDPELVFASDADKWASDWSKDGAYVLFTSQDKAGLDIWGIPMKGDRKPFPLVKTKFNELFATFSPDGKYIAYWSDESGRPEVYVQEFPEARNKYQVSTDGGAEPFWRADGKELFYRNGLRVMAVPVTPGPEFSAGTPQQLFQARFSTLLARSHFRPTADGQRFLALLNLSREAAKPAEVVLNWTAALNKQ